MKKLSNICKLIVRIDASQLNPFSICQDTPTRFYTRWEFDTNMQKFTARDNRWRNFKNNFVSFYQKTRPDCKMRAFSHIENRKKSNVLMWMVNVITVKQYLGQWDGMLLLLLFQSRILYLLNRSGYGTR